MYDSVGGKASHCAADHIGVNLIDGSFVSGTGDESRGCSCVCVPAVEAGFKESRPEYGSRAGVSECYIVGEVAGLEGPGQELLAQHVKVVADGENSGLLVQVRDGRPLDASGGNSQCRVLHPLELRDVGSGCGWEPHRGGVLQDGAHQELVGGDHRLHLLTPGGAAQQLQDSNPGGRPGAEVINVGSESE